MRTRRPSVFSLALLALPLLHTATGQAQGDAGTRELPNDAGSGPIAPAVSGAEAEESAADAPGLVKQADGSYRFRGNSFDAVINRDGSLKMKDRFGSARSVFKYTKMPEDTSRKLNDNTNGTWSLSFLEAKYDIFGWLDKKHSKDPYTAERRWFLEHTAALREQLAGRALVERTQHALLTIWSLAGIDFAERRRRTFALWDDSPEDSFGQRARDTVIKFVREHCPRDSGMGFPDTQLQTLNAKRRSKALFAPY
jgi:hypothetical protein